ncbi:hypothetical protein COCNU_05G001160 [Cocos nucifera]|uniref:Uncharacterized protein n=1 Tax=Cocos nucifera TaxID=13894 RepID=A0A8K0I7L3_COCNU|nr:hypothetical protein COCNU_05G001160 [Cocos nucifera]
MGGQIGSRSTAKEGATIVGGGMATDRSLSWAQSSPSSIGAADDSMDNGDRCGAVKGGKSMVCDGKEEPGGGRWALALEKKTARGVEW